MADYNLFHFESDVYPSPLTNTSPIRHLLRCSFPTCECVMYSFVSHSAHVENCHHCGDCNKFITDLSYHRCLRPNQRGGHVDTNQELDLTHFRERVRSHLGTIITYKHRDEFDTPSIEHVFEQVHMSTKKLLTQLWMIHHAMMMEVVVSVLMEKAIEGGENEPTKFIQDTMYFKSKMHELHYPPEIETILTASMNEIVNKKDLFIEHTSQWYVVKVLGFEIKVAELRLFARASARGYIPMPAALNRYGYVNFKNVDEKCFHYTVTAHRYWDTEVAKGSSKEVLKNYKTWVKYLAKFNFKDVEPTVNIYFGIPLFEQRNKMCVNIFTHHKDKIVLMKRGSSDFNDICNLFLIRKQIDGQWRFHFVLIRNVDKFLGAFKQNRALFCQRCWRNFRTTTRHEAHVVKCRDENTKFTPVETFPPEDKRISFKRLELTLKYPYVLLYDFETFSKPVVDTHKGQSTVVNIEYIPASYSLCIIHDNDEELTMVEFEYYDGPNVVDHFYERVFELAEKYITIIRQTNNRSVPSLEDMQRHEAAVCCEICQREFSKGSDDLIAESESEEEETDDEEKIQKRKERNKKKPKIIKTYHHDHNTGKFLMSLCSFCNTRVRWKHELPALAHHAAGFDHHLLIRWLNSKVVNPKDLKVIAKSAEKFIHIEMTRRDARLPPVRGSYNPLDKRYTGSRKARVKLMDSLQFLPGSLASLTDALKKEGCTTFDLLRQGMKIMFPQAGTLTVDDENLLLSKLAFPYKSLSSLSVLQDNVPIPPRSEFYNDLKEEAVGDKEWETVQKLCQRFNITSFRDFTRVYTMLDVCLLSVIWMNFRSNCFKSYKLDPVYCITINSYTWSCWLYHCKPSIDYIRDPEILKFVKSGIRGGTSFCTRKIVRANNEQCPGGFDPTKERTHLAYYDVNALYSTSMLNAMPAEQFTKCTVEELLEYDWKTYENVDNKSWGFILNVDLEYPPEVQLATMDIPLMPVQHTVNLTELSVEQRASISRLETKMGRQFALTPRLMLPHYNRYGYTVYYKTLKYYLNKGIRLLKVNGGIKFRESPYFKSYIEYNAMKRKEAKTDSLKTLYKQLLNSLYGKCLESVDNLFEIKFAGSRAEALVYLADPSCKGFVIIKEDLTMFLFHPKTVRNDKPTATGFVVLEMAKMIFYQNYYDRLKVIFGDDCYSILMDTDSSICEIRDVNNDFWDKLVAHRQWFDFSKLPTGHPIFKKYAHLKNLRTENQGVIGIWKIESLNVWEIVAIRPKCYSLLYFDSSEDLKNKGIPAVAMRKYTHERYKDVVLKEEMVTSSVNLIRSYDHQILNITVDKIAFHSVDVYRVYPEKGNFNLSYPIGCYRLQEYNVPAGHE